MNNVTVSDTEVSLAASLYEAFRSHTLACKQLCLGGILGPEGSGGHAWTSGMRGHVM